MINKNALSETNKYAEIGSPCLVSFSSFKIVCNYLTVVPPLKRQYS